MKIERPNILLIFCDQLRAHGVEFNVLTGVSAASVTDAAKLHHFFQKHRLPYRQYIPLIAPSDRKEPYALPRLTELARSGR